LIVVDASALLEWLLATPRADAVAARLLADDETLHAPHLLDVEVVQTLRRLVLGKDLTAERASDAIEDLQLLPIERYSHQEMLPRIWSLRPSLTAYDASYVVLAEALEATLITCDSKLARSHGHDAKVVLI
jgi:predicted nucleic acid-binding protein